MNKCRILVPVGCRSDEGLSAPIIKRLKQNDTFEVCIFNIKTLGNFFHPHMQIDQEIQIIEPDIIFITGDRIEMTAAACAAFHKHVPIAHYFGGVINYPIATLDDINRHVISLWSDIQFVESKTCMLNIHALFKAIGKDYRQNHVVGITHLEDLEIDESLVPNEEYDLILFNPTTKIKEIQHYDRGDRKRIIIGKNPDIPYDDMTYSNFCWKPDYDNLPRPQFLGLLKNCKRFITNSSAAYYEAPAFLLPEQIVIEGDRNKQRSSKFYQLIKDGASDKIIEVLEQWWVDQQ